LGVFVAYGDHDYDSVGRALARKLKT
jgi:hypothetical protein